TARRKLQERRQFGAPLRITSFCARHGSSVRMDIISLKRCSASQAKETSSMSSTINAAALLVRAISQTHCLPSQGWRLRLPETRHFPGEPITSAIGARQAGAALPGQSSKAARREADER